MASQGQPPRPPVTLSGHPQLVGRDDEEERLIRSSSEEEEGEIVDASRDEHKRERDETKLAVEGTDKSTSSTMDVDTSRDVAAATVVPSLTNSASQHTLSRPVMPDPQQGEEGEVMDAKDIRSSEGRSQPSPPLIVDVIRGPEAVELAKRQKDGHANLIAADESLDVSPSPSERVGETMRLVDSDHDMMATDTDPARQSAGDLTPAVGASHPQNVPSAPSAPQHPLATSNEQIKIFNSDLDVPDRRPDASSAVDARRTATEDGRANAPGQGDMASSLGTDSGRDAANQVPITDASRSQKVFQVVSEAQDVPSVAKEPVSDSNNELVGATAESRSAGRPGTGVSIEASIVRVLKTSSHHRTDQIDADWRKITALNKQVARRATAAERAPLFVDCSAFQACHSPAEYQRLTAMERERMRLRLAKHLQRRRRRMSIKIACLRDTYRRLHRQWRVHCDRLDRVGEARDPSRRAGLYGNTGVSSQQLHHADHGLSGGGLAVSQGSAAGAGTNVGIAGSGCSSSAATNGSGNGDSHAITLDYAAPAGLMASATAAAMTRANRRNTQSSGLAGFGDAVRSEAEFLEILASLENADMQDPSIRAARTTAVEPEMAIKASDDEGGVGRSFDDDNGFVADPLAFYLSDFDPDFWSEEEKAIFARRYALFPKQFGKIAASLPHKTASQCVSYYYLTKKLAGHEYKLLLASRNRDRRRKTKLVKPKKGRGSALMADLKAADDGGDDDDASPLEPGTPVNSTPTALGRRQSSRALRVALSSSSAAGGGALLDTVKEQEDSRVEFGSHVAHKRRAEEGVEGANLEDANMRQGTAAKRARSGRGSRKAAASGVRSERKASSATTKGAEVDAAAMPSVAEANAIDGVHIPPTVASSKKRRTPAAGPRFRGDPEDDITNAQQAAESDPIITAGDDGSKHRGRQTTSSYWSVAERNEFLRSLAIVGKDWESIAHNLSTKSAAQARNFFLRNTNEADFVEAVNLAHSHAGQPLEQREGAADALVQHRTTTIATTTAQHTQPYPSESLRQDYDQKTDRANGEPLPGYFATRSPPRGLNINSLLNAEGDTADRRRASLQDWFGDDVQTRRAGNKDRTSSLNDNNDDDTEDEGEMRHHAGEERTELSHGQYSSHDDLRSRSLTRFDRSTGYAGRPMRDEMTTSYAPMRSHSLATGEHGLSPAPPTMHQHAYPHPHNDAYRGERSVAMLSPSMPPPPGYAPLSVYHSTTRRHGYAYGEHLLGTVTTQYGNRADAAGPRAMRGHPPEPPAYSYLSPRSAATQHQHAPAHPSRTPPPPRSYAYPGQTSNAVSSASRFAVSADHSARYTDSTPSGFYPPTSPGPSRTHGLLREYERPHHRLPSLRSPSPPPHRPSSTLPSPSGRHLYGDHNVYPPRSPSYPADRSR